MAQHRIFSSHQTSQYLFVFVTTGVCICVCISFNTIRWDKYHMAKDIHQTSPLIFTCLYLSLCLNLCLHLCLYLCFVFVFVRHMKSVPAFAAQIKRHPWKTYLIKIPQNSDKSDKTRKQIWASQSHSASWRKTATRLSILLSPDFGDVRHHF